MADNESRHDNGAKCEVCGEPSAGRTIDDVELCAMHGGLANGVSLIAAERKRQIEEKGWTFEHDDGHCYGELAKVAATLAVDGTDARVVDPDGTGSGFDMWGIEDRTRQKYPDPKDARIRLLVIAGALIAAEIDRLLRARAEGRTDG